MERTQEVDDEARHAHLDGLSARFVLDVVRIGGGCIGGGTAITTSSQRAHLGRR